ncbi:histidine kinase [Paenibacillus sp. IB182496]|uniref:Histidine kinase n=1 Tax=Paenibacillus sabuli TaxID=2772509 RepID=A0A927GS56_9BACL|nr:sensor histidine kinase [Paenibacillus sabuli]MBD2845685.1 histidine kinase [Paenibacillus sabuli]
MLYSLKSRLIASFIVLFVLSFGAMSVVLFNEARSVIRSYIESSALEKMTEYGSYIEMVQAQIYDISSLVFNSDITRSWDKAVSRPDLSEGEKMLRHLEMSDFLTRATNSYSSVSSVTLYRQQGLWVGVEDRIVEEDDFLRASWFGDFIARREHWVPSHVDPVELRGGSAEPVVSMLMPIGTFQPALARTVMKVNVSADYFLEPLGRIHLGESGTIYLLDKQGLPLLSQSNYRPAADMAVAVQRAAGGAQREGVVDLTGEGGVKEILVYKKLARTNWMLVGFVSETDLYGSLFRLRDTVAVLALLLLLLSIGVAIWLSHGISRPLSRLVPAMRHVQRGDFEEARLRLPPAGSVRNEVGLVTATFRNMVDRLRQHIKTEFELKLMRQQAEYKALLMQINPHFLFNTLELMSSLAMQRRADDNVQVIESLGRMLRFSLRMSDDLIPLADELAYAREYAAILTVRFGDRLDLTMTAELPEPRRIMIIKFILQPLIENAVKYSFGAGAEATVCVRVVRVDERRLSLTVEDNGPGVPGELRERLLQQAAEARLDDLLVSRSRQIGLGNVLSRCRLYYGALFEARIETSALGGARIELIVPIQEVNADVPRIDRG